VSRIDLWQQRLFRHVEREPGDGGAPPPLRRRQPAGQEPRQLAARIGLSSRQNLPALAPGRKSGADDADAFDKYADHERFPRTRLALFPPKPKALLRTVRTGRRSSSVAIQDAISGSTRPVCRL